MQQFSDVLKEAGDIFGKFMHLLIGSIGLEISEISTLPTIDLQGKNGSFLFPLKLPSVNHTN